MPGAYRDGTNSDNLGGGRKRERSIFYLDWVGRKWKRDIERSASKHRHLILWNGCYHSDYLFETNAHCYSSMKYLRNWCHSVHNWVQLFTVDATWNVEETGDIYTEGVVNLWQTGCFCRDSFRRAVIYYGEGWLCCVYGEGGQSPNLCSTVLRTKIVFSIFL